MNFLYLNQYKEVDFFFQFLFVIQIGVQGLSVSPVSQNLEIHAFAHLRNKLKILLFTALPCSKFHLSATI